MPPIEHAMLSASSAARWLVCTPSARLEYALGEQDGGPFAHEGTLAHQFAELAVRRALGPCDPEDEAQMDELRANPLYQPEMERHARSFASKVAWVWDRLEHRQVYVETRVSFNLWAPQGFGTADCILVGYDTDTGRKRLDVFDYKYGRGVRVSATDNPQLKLYALGAMHTGLTGDVPPAEIHLHIDQPRVSDGYSSDCLLYHRLIDWGYGISRIAYQAYMGNGVFQPSDETCRFCKVALRCPARIEQMSISPRAAELLNDDEIAEMLPLAKEWAKWVHRAEQHLLHRAMEGATIPGYKVVEGRRGKKRIEAGDTMLPDHFYKLVLKTPAEIRQEIGAELFDSLYADLVVQDRGKPILVPESDRRPEYRTAEMEFSAE